MAVNLEQELLLAKRRIQQLEEYYLAVDDEAVITGTLNEKLSAKEQLQAVIKWHIQVATDPVVNGGKVLVEKERIEKLEAVAQAARIASDTSEDHLMCPHRHNDLMEALAALEESK